MKRFTLIAILATCIGCVGCGARYISSGEAHQHLALQAEGHYRQQQQLDSLSRAAAELRHELDSLKAVR